MTKKARPRLREPASWFHLVLFRPTDQIDLEPIERFNIVSTIKGLNFIELDSVSDLVDLVGRMAHSQQPMEMRPVKVKPKLVICCFMNIILNDYFNFPTSILLEIRVSSLRSATGWHLK